MSITLPSFTQPAATRRFRRLVRIVFGWTRNIARHFADRDAIKNLSELSDRELRDIGITRDQIEDAVRGTMTDPDGARF
jgi:uncharacterized protein YjiS (DUF1127 family)